MALIRGEKFGVYGYFWSSSILSGHSYVTYRIIMRNYQSHVFLNYESQRNGHSIRCVAD